MGAYIYFDFNEPVVTNTAINTIETVTKIKLRTDVLLEFPEIGKYFLESQYRELIEGNYRIIYRYDKLNEEIRIVSVFHSSRDIESLIVK